MSTRPEEDRFAAALHQTAAFMPVPDPQELYQGSLRRGHAIRRRRRLTAGAGAGLAACAVAALAFVLPGNGPGRPVATASTTPTAPTASSTPSTTPTGAAQVLSALEQMLPAGTSPLNGPDGGPGIIGPSKDHGSGLWFVQAYMNVQGSGAKGDSSIDFTLYDGAWARSCAEAGSRLGIVGDCTSRSLDGGELFRILRSDAYSPTEVYIWLSPAGFTTELLFTSQGAADFPLTASQVDDVLTDPLWATVVGQLPH